MNNIKSNKGIMDSVNEYMYIKSSVFDSNKILSNVKEKMLNISHNNMSAKMKENILENYIVIMIMNVETTISESLKNPMSRRTRYFLSLHEPSEAVPTPLLEASEVLYDLERIVFDKESVESVTGYKCE